jgi:DNA helicase-2/ATP-dependent DNA helicase PcrA
LGVHPYHILAVTFTNKAAREMGNRVVELLGQRIRGLTLGTFHATCARILRREAEHLPINSDYVIWDSDDQINVVKRVLKDLDLDDKRYRPYSVHASISRAKNELILADDYPVQTYRDEVVKRIYHRYQQMLLSSNAVDFDDLLLWTAFLLEQQSIVRERYARRYEHILVDEFQDTNMAQYILLKHLSSFHKNIFVVGDTDQSIYRWRGADYRNVLRFEQDFPDLQTILLEQNYRSTQTILDTAMAVIDQNPYRTPKRLFTDRGDGKKIVLKETFDDREEASIVVDTIAKLIASGESEPRDFAIMYRTNAQSRVLEETFLSANLPYKLVGAQRFYGRREIKDILAYIRLTHNPDDEISLLRVINTPARGIGDKTLFSLRTHAQKKELTPGRMILDLGKGDESDYRDAFSKRAAGVLSQFGRLLRSWRSFKDGASPLELMDRILEDIDYRSYLDHRTEEGQERWENVMELRRLAAEYRERDLEEFLEDISLVSDQDTLDESANAPTLLTLHAAKGLEFPQVFIVGMNDGTLPHARSFEEPEAMQEERRLFYVGITRAKDRLYLLNPLHRYTYGYAEPADPSRFLGDIPSDLVLDGRPRAVRHTRSRPDSWESSIAETAHILTTEYRAGMRVEHPKWGEGLVLNSRLQDDDEIVDVFFEEIGLKRVVASLANLEVKA